jgi:uncharacterized Fe-S center protein
LLIGRDGSSAAYEMRRCAALILAVAAAVAACIAVVPGASAAGAWPAGGARRLATGNPWGKAQEVPGTAALNKGENAQITSVSCASAGNCSAGGYYLSVSGFQAFVVSEVHGRWRKAEEVPGTAALNGAGNARITSLSCVSAGNCGAGGYVTSGGIGRPLGQEAFVVSEVHGRWRKADALHRRYYAQITSVSCASAGNCGAGGYYIVVDGSAETPFVVSEVHGRWRKAEEVPGTAALNTAGYAEITSVSCASAGNCSAGGYYTFVGIGGGAYRQEAFVVKEVHGTWRTARKVPGTAALNTGGVAQTTSVSCASAGNCSAGGYYDVNQSRTGEAFVASEVHGTWRKAEEVPGTAVLNKDGSAQITSVSCASAGNCSAGGYYGSIGTGRSHRQEAFVVTEVHGTWRKAEEVPGAALNTAENAQFTSVSCASAGNCSAGGYYSGGYYPNGKEKSQALVVSEVNGTWRKAEEVPGTAALSNRRGAQITSVSCGSAGHCSAGGSYAVSRRGGNTQAFVASRE